MSSPAFTVVLRPPGLWEKGGPDIPSWPCLWDRAHHLALRPLASPLMLGNTIKEMSLLWGFLASTLDFPVSNFPRKPACLRGMQ